MLQSRGGAGRSTLLSKIMFPHRDYLGKLTLATFCLFLFFLPDGAKSCNKFHFGPGPFLKKCTTVVYLRSPKVGQEQAFSLRPDKNISRLLNLLSPYLGPKLHSEPPPIQREANLTASSASSANTHQLLCILKGSTVPVSASLKESQKSLTHFCQHSRIHHL